MIKVNLLYDRSTIKQQAGPVESSTFDNATAFKDIFGDDVGVKQSGGQLSSVLKLLLMLSFTAGLYYFETVQTKANKSLISSKQVELKELKSLLETKKNVVANLESLKDRFSKERLFIEATRNELVKRMHFLRGLDSIQTAVVPNLWLTGVSFSDGVFSVDGQALYKSDLDSFYENLNRVPFFNKVIIVKDSKSQSRASGAFEFSIRTETKKNALGGV